MLSISTGLKCVFKGLMSFPESHSAIQCLYGAFECQSEKVELFFFLFCFFLKVAKQQLLINDKLLTVNVDYFY